MKREHPTRWDTALLEKAAGNRAPLDALLPELYDRLRAMAARAISNEHPGHTLQPTALVHEVYLKLLGDAQIDAANRTRFLGAAAVAMRRVLIDHAKCRKAQKRGGADARNHVSLSGIDIASGSGAADPDDLLALDEALDELDRENSRAAKVVLLRFYGGLTNEEVAGELGISQRTVNADWEVAKFRLKLLIRGPQRG